MRNIYFLNKFGEKISYIILNSVHKQIIITLSYFNKGCSKIHAKFEFYAICAIKCCQRKKKDSDITDSLRLLKMKNFAIRKNNVFSLLNNIFKIIKV